MNLVEQLRSWAQNEEMIDASFTEHGQVCNAAANEIARLRAQLDDQNDERVETICALRDEIARLEGLILSEDGLHGEDPGSGGSHEDCAFCHEIARIKKREGR